MKRLIIICEGETEQEFCSAILTDYFFHRDIVVQSPLIKVSHGGIVSWKKLSKEIEVHLKQDRQAHVTTFIDLYALPSDYPNFNPSDVDRMERGMKDGIDGTLSGRFIPYIQRHEFECFLFASLDVLKSAFVKTTNDFTEIGKVVSKYQSNLEDINCGSATAPSKRLAVYLPEYKKGLDGAYLVHEIGLPTVGSKCPRFNTWIAKLEGI